MKALRNPARRGRRMMWFAFAGSLVLAAPADARRVHRSIFYSEMPFGSLALVRSQATRAQARSSLTVEDFQDQTCLALPMSGPQWFIVNHRSDELDGQVGYFSIRILYQFENSGEEQPLETRTGIHLQRNASWYLENGTQVTRDYQRQPEQISLSESAFIDLHNPATDKEPERLAQLEAAVGAWHMRPTPEDDSSWSDRHLYGPMLRAYLSGTTGAISARLIRFTATSSSSSTEPILFWLDPRGARSATILVDAPRHDYQGSRRVYSVMFDGPCPEE